MADDSDPHALTRLLGDAPDPAESVDEQRTRRAVLAGLFGAVEEPTMIDRYALERRVGHGGLGVVYAARDPKLGRRVAIKLVPIQPGGNPDRVAREARALAALVHPNVVAVHDVGAYEHGAQSGVFIVMDLVEGQDLAQWLATSRTWQERAQVFIQAGRGLEAAHRVGMVHRDFKPGNVLIGDDGRVCVVDFGLARAADSAAEPTLDPGLDKSSAPIRVGPMTEVGSVMGTPRYMAPEQHLGEPVDARTDVYSYCASLYEALSGQPAFTQDSIAELLAAKRAGPPRPASSHPAWLWRLVLEGMQPDPDDRPASMTELLSALEQGMRPKRRWGRAAAVTLGACQPAAEPQPVDAEPTPDASAMAPMEAVPAATPESTPPQAATPAPAASTPAAPPKASAPRPAPRPAPAPEPTPPPADPMAGHDMSKMDGMTMPPKQ